MTPKENVLVNLQRIRDQLENKLVTNGEKIKALARVAPSHAEHLEQAIYKHKKAHEVAQATSEEHQDFAEFLIKNPDKDTPTRREHLRFLERTKQETEEGFRQRSE